MPFVAEAFANILEVGLRTVFDLQATSLTGMSLAQFFNTVKSDRANEYTQGYGGMSDVPEYNGSLNYDRFDLLWKTTFSHKEYAEALAVERKLLDDDQYAVISNNAKKMGMVFQRTREKHRASIFNNAFSASYLGPDGKALCATDHLTNPVDTTAMSNKGSTALSYDSVIATRKLMRKYKDDKNELILVNPTTVIIPPDLEDVAQTIKLSINKPGTANNDANVTRQLNFDYVVCDYLSDTNNWFMMDPEIGKMHLWWFDRVLPEFELDPTSRYELKLKFRGYMRYSYGFDDWRWIYGHEVA